MSLTAYRLQVVYVHNHPHHHCGRLEIDLGSTKMSGGLQKRIHGVVWLVICERRNTR